MARHIASMAFSPEAKAVLSEGRKLWQRFHATQFPRKIRDELKPNRPGAGWYQVRKALVVYGDTELTDLDPFNAAYAVLGNKLRPMAFCLRRLGSRVPLRQPFRLPPPHRKSMGRLWGGPPA